MHWTSESIHDKIINIMDELRKYKVYILSIIVLVVVGMIILIPKKEQLDIQLKLIGPELVNIYIGDTYEELGFEAYDANNNNYEKEVIVESNLNINKTGKYQIKYKIGDKEVIRVVVVKPRTNYEIKLEKIEEEETIYLRINQEYKDPGYKVIDKNGKDITGKVEVRIEGEVDVSKSGKYTVIYKVIGLNGEIITAQREVVVIENKLEISVNQNIPTNKNVIINIKIVDEYFEYLELPKGEKVNKTEYTYSVDKNGIYKFILHNKHGLNIEEEIEIKNIYKEKPTGTCIATVQNGKTTIHVTTNDNIKINKYVIGQKQYTTNTIVLDKEQNNVNIELYDEAGNKNNIVCEIRNKNLQITLTPSTTSYINGNVNIEAKVKSEYFDYLVLPNGKRVYNKNYTYTVSQNGTYKFTVYNKDGQNTSNSITVKNIDKEKPTGTCTAIIQNGRTIINISARDNVGVNNYLIGNKQYTTSTITLDNVQKDISIDVYDKVGNKNTIACTALNKMLKLTLTPSATTYTNQNLNIAVGVESEYFDYLVLPNGNKVYNKNYTYVVSANGTYSFSVYNKDGQNKTESITIKNIDREVPNGSCFIKKDASGVFIEVNANDNIGISKYEYNGKEYTSNVIRLANVTPVTKLDIFDKANNKKTISCSNLVSPKIESISQNGVIINVKSIKEDSNIAGYYFSYNNTRPNKSAGGYIATSNQEIEVVRLPGTTYVWVEDAKGNISEAKSISITNDAILMTGQLNGYTVLRNTRLGDYLQSQGWSLKAFNTLISNSVLASGYNTKEGAATAGMALQLVLAQRYKIKIPYWMGGKTDSWGASIYWGMYRENPTYPGYNYYGMDCDGFVNWAFKNTGLSYSSILGNSYYFWDGLPLSKANGEIGDVIRRDGHVSLIIGKAEDGFIIAEAFGESQGLVINKHKYTQSSQYIIIKGERLIQNYAKVSLSEYLAAFS